MFFAESRRFLTKSRGVYEGNKGSFFDFARIYREKFPVNDEICSKSSTKIGYDGIKGKYRHPFPHIFLQKSPVKAEQREWAGDFTG